jgi:undecaprenyl-diphosphatase
VQRRGGDRADHGERAGRTRGTARIRDARRLTPDRATREASGRAAAMSVAFVYAMAFPPLAIVLIPVAMIVGASRVVLGVHYPGDVLIGQVIAVLTAIPVLFR